MTTLPVMWAVNTPPSARNPMTSTEPAVMLRTVGSSQLLGMLSTCVVIHLSGRRAVARNGRGKHERRCGERRQARDADGVRPAGMGEDHQTCTNEKACEGQRPEQPSSIDRIGARPVEDVGLDVVRVQVSAKKKADEQHKRGVEVGGDTDGAIHD